MTEDAVERDPDSCSPWRNGNDNVARRSHVPAALHSSNRTSNRNSRGRDFSEGGGFGDDVRSGRCGSRRRWFPDFNRDIRRAFRRTAFNVTDRIPRRRKVAGRCLAGRRRALSQLGNTRPCSWTSRAQQLIPPHRVPGIPDDCMPPPDSEDADPGDGAVVPMDCRRCPVHQSTGPDAPPQASGIACRSPGRLALNAVDRFIPVPTREGGIPACAEAGAGGPEPTGVARSDQLPPSAGRGGRWPGRSIRTCLT